MQRRNFLQQCAAFTIGATAARTQEPGRPVGAGADRRQVALASKPNLLTAPFGESEAKAAQRAWATYLKVEPERTNKLGMRLALIPPGGFQMGSSSADVDAAVAAAASFKAEYAQDEQPQHRVRITEPYWLGVYEVTQEEWKAVMGNQPSWFSRNGGGKE